MRGQDRGAGGLRVLAKFQSAWIAPRRPVTVKSPRLRHGVRDPKAGIVTSGKVTTLDDAKAEFETVWRGSHDSQYGSLYRGNIPPGV